MAAKMNVSVPEVGAIVAFKPSASERLAHIPGRVKRVVARLNNGDYLVSLEYTTPVKLPSGSIQNVDAFASHLYPAAA